MKRTTGWIALLLMAMTAFGSAQEAKKTSAADVRSQLIGA